MRLNGRPPPWCQVRLGFQRHMALKGATAAGKAKSKAKSNATAKPPAKSQKSPVKPGGKPLPSLHSSLFYPQPEAALKSALESMASLAIGLLHE